MAFFADTICTLNLGLIWCVKLYHFTKAYVATTDDDLNLQCRPELGRSFQKKVYFKRKDQSRQGRVGKTSLDEDECGGKYKTKTRGSQKNRN